MIITKENLEKFKRDVKSALKEVEEKYGVTIDCAGASYDMNKFSMPLKVKNVSESGLDVETQDAINYLPWFAKIYGKSFKEGRHTYKVVGYENHTKYSVKCIREKDGREFSFTDGIAREGAVEWQ
jgi:hypothetical protein